ncbi:hypothetical protein XANCAGTX0491_001852 [Xanthoria calcicola]
MGKQASRPINIPRSTYHPYRRTTTTTTLSRNTVCRRIGDFDELEEGEIAEDSPAYSRSSSRSFWDTDSRSSCSSSSSYSSSSGFCRSIDRYTPFQDQLRPCSGESQLDYYIRTAPYKYKRYAPISRHSGIVHSPRILESTCAATIPGQKTCVHPSTAPGDIVNYVPMGCPEDVSGDCPGGGKLSMHFMVLLPVYYKPVDLQANPDYHAALVITKNPIGSSTLLCPQPGDQHFRAENVPHFKTLMFDAHSPRRSLILDDEVEWAWKWKPNTSVGYHIKTVHQDSLHAVIIPGQPTYGLRLSDGSFQQLLRDMGEEEEELEMARLEFVNSKKLTRGLGRAAGKSSLCQSLGDHPATVPSPSVTD